MDTIITARKRVVVTKEIIIENHIVAPPFFHDKSFHVFVSKGWYNNLQQESQMPATTTTSTKGIGVGCELQSNIKELLRAGLRIKYSTFKQNGILHSVGFMPVENTYFVNDTIETFYIGKDSFYITTKVPKTVLDSVSFTEHLPQKQVYSNYDFEIDVGKQFNFTYCSVYPKLNVGYRICKYSESQYDENGMIVFSNTHNRNFYRFGISCLFSVPIFSHYGIDLCLHYNFFNTQKSIINYLKSETYSANFGVHYNFN